MNQNVHLIYQKYFGVRQLFQFFLTYTDDTQDDAADPQKNTESWLKLNEESMQQSAKRLQYFSHILFPLKLRRTIDRLFIDVARWPK